MFKPTSKASKIFKRLISNTPDNAPGVADNEEWLQQLNKTSFSKKKLREKVDQQIQNSKGNNELSGPKHFPHRIVSKPPESPYIHVSAPLSNFTSMNYLAQNTHRHAQAKSFVDLRIIKCRSGKGGDGVVSFFRDAGRAIGPPDGGDGGDGGSVYVRTAEGINTLTKLRTTYIAEDGHNGASDQLDGARGKDTLITVPVGTVVKWCMDPKVVREYIQQKQQERGGGPLREMLNNSMVDLQCLGRFEMDQKPTHIQLFRENCEPGEDWLFKGKTRDFHLEKDWFQELNEKVKVYDHELTDAELESDRFPLFGIDLDKPTEKPINILKGGKGGLGNMHFLTNLIRNPRFAKSGRNGLEQFFMFELKSLADLGLVGLPNAGKSTILNRISNAKPRIGHWEFTTLHPTIGTISLGIDKPSFTVADIPGIIKDASKDKGMGLEFLRHIERSKGLVFVISLENKEPLNDLQTLIDELGGMDKVVEKNVLVVCNKADIDCQKPSSVSKFLKIQEHCSQFGWDIIPISALRGENIDILLEKMAKCANKL